MRSIVYLALFVLLQSCVHKQEIKSINKNNNQSDIPVCFKLIFDNKFLEFKDRIIECKNFKNKMGITTLMMSIVKENIDFVEYLIAQKVDINEADNAGITALVYAANKNNI